LGLYPEESPGQFKLKSASRDGEAIDLDVSFDSNSLKWEIDRNYQEVQALETDFAMLALLREMGKVSIDAICQANEKSRTANKRAIDRLIEQDLVSKEVTKVGYQTVYVFYAK
jgi:predicted HTH transcriptional regulator